MKENSITVMTYDRDEIEQWTEVLIEGTITPEEFRCLSSVVLNDSEAMEAHVDYLFNHAALSYGIGEICVRDAHLDFLLDSRDPFGSLPRRKTIGKPEGGGRFLLRLFPLVGTVSCLSALCFFAVLFFLRPVSEETRHFATIQRTTDCLWGDSMTETRPGSRLGPCILHLNQGIALIHFDCDVTVSLEGPSVFRIDDAKYTVLESGNLVATVESSKGKGFVVDTAKATIRDYGTKFGLNVAENEETAVYVIEGSVDVIRKPCSETFSLQKGETYLFKSEVSDDASIRPACQLSTEVGRGAETWVFRAPSIPQSVSMQFPEGITETYMHVKLSTESDSRSDRKAIFRIALDSWKREEPLRDAQLLLSYGPTGIGYASLVPDATFTVYGLTDEAFDEWNEETLDWDSLPGNTERDGMSPSVWKTLGSFQIRQASPSGTVRIGGKDLCDFLLADTNGLATFAIVCKTPATEPYGIVRGFANRYHKSLSPPRLFLYENGDEPAPLP